MRLNLDRLITANTVSLVAVLLILVLAMSAKGAPPQFQVENKCPCQFVVANKIVPKKMPAPGCVCAGDCKCADGTCPGSCPVQAQAAPVVQYQWVQRRVGVFRSQWVLEPVQSAQPQQVGGATCVNGTCTSFK